MVGGCEMDGGGCESDCELWKLDSDAIAAAVFRPMQFPRVISNRIRPKRLLI